MTEQTKIVDYEKYCKTCKYENCTEEEDPCFDCLEDPVNTYSEKPTKWEEKK